MRTYNDERFSTCSKTRVRFESRLKLEEELFSIKKAPHLQVTPLAVLRQAQGFGGYFQVR